jgi:3'-phosphoadenosine 5'-phosphosulfate sulfotransferase (PAPS reductase)/FAD synthetase
LNWTEAEVIELHARYNVRPNPLYLGGASRVGCYPCIFARKNEIRHLAATAPERVEHIAQLEERVTQLRQAATPGAAQATFFKSKRPDVPKMSIREVVEWSRTKGGEVIDDVAEQEEQGCMRWGLCETPRQEGDE